MLKMYRSNTTQIGGSPEFWEENWVGEDPQSQLRFCEVDPLRPVFERYTQAGTVMLEGGCGMGQYVFYYAARGVRVVGLDFAGRTLARIHERCPNLMLCAGDVAALPFGDNLFDTYYSGGVVEHFEGGVKSALHEARRVLRPGGTLLISVPYFSPLRRLLSLRRDEWKTVFVAQVDGVTNADNRRFFQYAYTPAEFKKLLARLGFRVLSTQGYAVIWGMYEIPLIGRALSSVKYSKSRETDVQGSKNPDGSLGRDSGMRSLIRRLAVSEDDSVPVLGMGVRMLRWACANMMMYVCTRGELGD